jgi:RimJ/RimL family protein N-acetyltransferase
VTAPEPIRTARLELPALTVDQYDRLLAGDREGVGAELGADIGAEWLEDARWLIALRREQLRDHPDHRPWLIRPVLRREPEERSEAIGYVNFHAPPNDEGTAEIGYALLAAWRGRGYALEAAAGALAWAAADPRVRTLRASVAPDNVASLRLVGKLGFVQVGEQWDPDDGLELVHDVDRDAFLERHAADR